MLTKVEPKFDKIENFLQNYFSLAFDINNGFLIQEIKDCNFQTLRLIRKTTSRNTSSKPIPWAFVKKETRKLEEQPVSVLLGAK